MKLCVNPTHLRADTFEQNVQDAYDEGLFPDYIGRRVLSPREDEIVRRRRADGDSARLLAEEYGCCRNTIYRAAARAEAVRAESGQADAGTGTPEARSTGI